MSNFVGYICVLMERENFLSGFLVEGCEQISIILLALLVLMFVVQLIYCLVVYGRICGYRNPAPSEEAKGLGVSVIIPLYEADHGFLDDRLPLFLEQRHKNYEVVVVDVTGDKEVNDQLSMMRIKWGDRLTTTRLAADPLFPISTKMALNVGIKAARYDNLLFTLPDCSPRSERWAEVMARGFVGHDVVLGYTSLMGRKAMWNRTIRCANMALSVRWLSTAVRHRPHRGVLSNLGFTKQIYFSARGFNHLNLNMGEDDLFVQKIANRNNTVAIMGGSATLDERSWAGLDWWFPRRLRTSYPFRFYPARVKWSTGVELWSRALFFLLAVVVAVILPPYSKMVAGGLLLLRFVLLWWQMKRISRRLSERGFLSMWWLYDLVAPAVEAVLAVWRKFVPKYKWR